MRPEAFQRQPKWLDAQQPREGRYVLGPLLGQGGVGEVREAWDVVLCRTVALKVLRKMDPSSLIRFMHEARLQSRLVHPNICQIFDVDSSETAPRIAMQLVRGPTLADVCAALAVGEIVQILAQVADAVHAAHRLKLIHRDLKPSNILLDPAPDGGWTPYVCDFGLAMELDEPTMTAPQWVNGTPAYMAPEQVRGERSRIGPATDVYALGGTLHFALHGRPPGGRNSGAWPDGASRPVPRDLDLIMRKCLEPDPLLRYPTAAALAEDLWHFSNGEPVQARPAGRLAMHWRQWHRAWKLAFQATVAASALAAALAAQQRHLASAARGRSQWERFYVLQGGAMAHDLELERMLPPHDLEPAYGRLRTRLDELGARLPAQGRYAQGPGHFALGEGRFLLGDWPGAQRELDQAQAQGFRGPEVAQLQARILAAAQERSGQEAQFTTGLQAPAPEAGRIAALFRQGAAPEARPAPSAEALVAFLSRDYTRAAALGRAASAVQPWQDGAEVTTVRSLAAQGRQAAAAGDTLLAQMRFDEALDLAKDCLERTPSDEAAQHACLLADRGLASLQLDRKALSPAFLDGLQQAGDKALALNPQNPDLQDDCLFLAFLKARRLLDLEQDPGPVLDAALGSLAAWEREPLTPALRADRMLLHWLRAERTFRQGGDPGPDLDQALRDPGHTPFLDRDYLGEVQNFQAQVAAARGQDPRPVLDQAMAWMAPRLGPDAPCSLCATAAQSWLIRSHWEATHGLDPRPSLRRSQALALRALGRRPGALAGLH